MSDSVYDAPRTTWFKVWHIPQIPMKAFIVDCDTIVEAKKLQDVLADYDLFQYDNKVKPDYSNASGIVMWSDDDEGYVDLDDDEVAELLELAGASA